MQSDTKVELVWITPNAESLIAEMARVSNPANAKNPSYTGLIKYLIKEKHWSPFEMGNLCFSIHTTRRIAPQLLRHGMKFQEFSQRYSKVEEFAKVNPREQDLKNRQSSHDTLSEETKKWFQDNINNLQEKAYDFYEAGLEKGISKESMAFVLPPTAKTHIYANGMIRNWMHYVDLRTGNGTQLEHREIAEQVKLIMIEKLPNLSEAMGWK